MTSAAFGTCGDCNRPRAPGAIFCECGALLDYSASGDGRGNGKVNGTAVAVAAAPPTPPSQAADNEWPPGPYHRLHEHSVTEAQPMRVVHCPNEKCKALNPSRLLVCWRCGTSMIQGEEAEEAHPSRSWRRFLLMRDNEPLAAGEREYPKEPFLSRDPRSLLRNGLIAAGVLLLGTVLVIAVVKAWHPAYSNGKQAYAYSREKLFPRFTPHHPSSVYPTNVWTSAEIESLRLGTPRQPGVQPRPLPKKGTPIPHPAADAFDRNLSTYWQSTTPRQVWDNLRVNFKPAIKQFTDVSVFAGDPTARTVVPRELQMTFYRWEPHPDLHTGDCKGNSSSHFPARQSRGTFCVIGKPQIVHLLNTPAEQRFSIGTHENVAQIVVTVRGVHRTTSKIAQAALTDIEFFDRH